MPSLREVKERQLRHPAVANGYAEARLRSEGPPRPANQDNDAGPDGDGKRDDPT
jgi:hypothetical protein